MDKIIEGKDPESLSGAKNVTATEEYFNDHFPLKPVLPGVMIIESLTGLAGLLAERLPGSPSKSPLKPVLTSLKKIKFRKFVQPGDQLVLEEKISDQAPGKITLKTKALVNGKNAATGMAAFDLLDEATYRERFIAL